MSTPPMRAAGQRAGRTTDRGANEMKTLLVHVTPRATGLEHGARYAMELAMHYGAHLTALVSDVEAHAPAVANNMQDETGSFC